MHDVRVLFMHILQRFNSFIRLHSRHFFSFKIAHMRKMFPLCSQLSVRLKGYTFGIVGISEKVYERKENFISTKLAIIIVSKNAPSIEKNRRVSIHNKTIGAIFSTLP